jgi:uncharacterized membrane protein
MTDRIIVATFDTPSAAHDAATAIKGLKDAGVADFRLKAGVMVSKDDKGNVSVLEDKNRSLFGTMIGTASGALVGLVAGPAGSILGAGVGATAGLASDALMAGFDDSFVEDVIGDMRPGTTAIIVEAEEESTRPFDDIVALGHGHVDRYTA